MALDASRSGGRRPKAKQITCIREMEINTAMIIAHDGVECGKKSDRSTNGCSITNMVSTENKKQAKDGTDRRYQSRHLMEDDDNRVAIHCYRYRILPGGP